jgi:hypothetical protein
MATKLRIATSEIKWSEKNMVARDHFPLHPAIFRHESPSGVRGQSLPELDTSARSIKTCIKQIFVLA